MATESNESNVLLNSNSQIQQHISSQASHAATDSSSSIQLDHIDNKPTVSSSVAATAAAASAAASKRSNRATTKRKVKYEESSDEDDENLDDVLGGDDEMDEAAEQSDDSDFDINPNASSSAKSKSANAHVPAAQLAEAPPVMVAMPTKIFEKMLDYRLNPSNGQPELLVKYKVNRRAPFFCEHH